MAILLTNRPYMFTVFSTDRDHYLSVVAGTVGLYTVTIRLSGEEAAAFQRDEEQAIAFARDVLAHPAAYEARRVHPPIDPE